MPSDKVGGMAPVYPIHNLPPHKRKLTSRETVRELMARELDAREQEKRDQTNLQRQAYVSDHPMVKGHEPRTIGNSTVDTLNQIKYRLAREAASLEFTRTTLESKVLDTTQISKQIVATWKQVAGIELEIKKHGVTVLDPNSEEVQRILRLWMEMMKSTLLEMIKDQSISSESVDLFFNKFASALEGWEGRLENR